MNKSEKKNIDKINKQLTGKKPGKINSEDC